MNRFANRKQKINLINPMMHKNHKWFDIRIRVEAGIIYAALLDTIIITCIQTANGPLLAIK